MESPIRRSPDLTVNPIMDMEQEDEAIMTDEDEDGDEDGDKSDEPLSGVDTSHSAEQEEDEDGDEDGDESDEPLSGEDATHSAEQEDDEDDEPNLSLPTHASFVSASPTLSEVDDPDESLVPPAPMKAGKSKGKGRVVQNSEDELDLIASPAKHGGKKKALRETPEVASIREKLQGVSLEAPSKRVTRSRLKN